MSDIEVAHAKSLLRREIDASPRFTADYFVSSDMVESGEHAGCTRASVELNELSRRCVDILRELARLKHDGWDTGHVPDPVPALNFASQNSANDGQRRKMGAEAHHRYALGPDRDRAWDLACELCDPDVEVVAKGAGLWPQRLRLDVLPEPLREEIAESIRAAPLGPFERVAVTFVWTGGWLVLRAVPHKHKGAIKPCRLAPQVGAGR